MRWRSKLTKDFHDEIALGQSMHAKLVREVILVPNASHVFHVSTEDSVHKGVTYAVTVADFPQCTCEDFQKCDNQHLTYVPCKHMYFVFFCVLGLDSVAHEFIHQAALTKAELFQGIGGADF